MYKPRSPSASPRVVIVAMICMCLSAATFAAPPASVRIYVDLSATGNHTGTTWTDAYPDVHDALAEAATIASPTTPVEIWVAEGLYQPDHGTGDRLGMYQVPAYTELYGGFAGTEVVRSQRDWHAHPTILDGDLLANDDLSFVPTSDCCSEHAGSGCDDAACTAKVVALDDDCTNPLYNYWANDCVNYAMQQCCDICRPSRCDNSFRIIDVPDGDGVVIDGFTIQNGEASDYQIPTPTLPTVGGGLYVDRGKITIRNILFTGNAASGGSAARMINGESLIEFCTVVGNTTFGGLSDAMSVAPSFVGTPIVRDCVFSNNRGSSLLTNDGVEVRRCFFTGSGKYVNAVTTSGTSLIADSWFIGNYTGDFPTVYVSGFSAIVNCLFMGNVGEQGGPTLLASSAYVVDCAFIGNVNATGNFIAALGDPFSSGTVVNSLFVGNRVASGGALAGKLQIYNSIFWGNRDDDPNTSTQAEQIYPLPPGNVQQIDYSIVEGWDGSLGGVGNSGVDPLFVDPLGLDMLPATGDENYRLSFDSPAIDAGHPSPPLLAVRDLDGHRRTLCAATDLGPYEFGIADADCDGDTDLADYFGLPACLTGPTPIALPASCHPFDFDADDAVDLSDVAGFANSFSGP